MKPTLYPNGFPSAYEELKTFYPVFYRDVFEMDAIWRAAGGGLDEIEDGVDAVVNNNFVSLMDTDTLAQMETFLGIPLNQKRTLEARRKLVALYFIGGNHIGSQEIKDIVFGYTGASSSVEFKNSRIYVKLFPNDNSTFLSSDVMECLKRKIPAHLSLSLVLAYIPDLQPAYVAAAPCGMAAFCTVRLPGSIKPRAVTARGYVAGAMSAARMQTTVELPGAIHPKNITAQAYATGGLAHTHETVTIKSGGQTTGAGKNPVIQLPGPRSCRNPSPAARSPSPAP